MTANLAKDLVKNLTDTQVAKEVERQVEILEFGTAEITPRDEFLKMLTHSIKTATPLRVKCGIDPTSTDVHIGHTVPYRKMKQFQDLGHIGVVIIGDYTAQIGDPSGKSESRQSLSAEQTKENAKKYLEQVYSVLNPDRTEVKFQSEWFKDVSLSDVMKWAGQTTVAKLLSHDTFGARIEKGFSLGLHELFYPVLQGIDSVYVNADVELGGTDQKFNVLMGRDYQRHAGKRPQCAMLMPIITGTCGTQKMSKSLGNYIGILDAPFDKFGKVMSIPDALMEEYILYATNFETPKKMELIGQMKSHSIHPNDLKKSIASNIVGIFHGEEIGVAMKDQFEHVFAKNKIPDEVPEYSLVAGDKLIAVLTGSKLLGSNGEVRRMVKQNAVGFVDGDKITDAEFTFSAEHKGQVIKIGKRKFLKLI
ncbi:tyrosine--tRNA ligase [Bacteriovoracaceae bacterium]|nr:tyrosine--tRNA ligase [Bacteriovoracaceae bacterium]